jgi:hypothetical protein
MISTRFQSIARQVLVAMAFSGIVLSAYVLSILWRVSLEEFDLFGRSDLIPLSLRQRKFNDMPSADSYGDKTYSFLQNGKSINVYEQRINSFQHVYGSALASKELGEGVADYLFRANEYFEALFWRNSGTIEFYLDTKKDLGNNAVGRTIGQLARRGEKSTQSMIDDVLLAMDDGRVYLHFRDARVQSLPTLEKFGCPLLAKLQQLRRLRLDQEFE